VSRYKLGETKPITWEVSENGCHICTSHPKDKNGYPKLKMFRKAVRANRLIYKNNFGEIPDGLFVLHKCDNPACINPDHLFLGTNNDNIQDMIKKGRKVTCPGEKHWNSILTEKQIIEIANTKGLTQKELAKVYGVSRGTIGHIKRMERWEYLFKNKEENGIDLTYKKEGFQKGVRHYAAKFTEQDIKIIREKTDINCHQMAKLFGVAFQTISDIRRRKSWKHIQ
jgi:DNA-binding XRE family transcriptional regulator